MGFRAERLAADEPLQLRGLTCSTTFLGFHPRPGYELLLDQLEVFGAVDRVGDPARPMSGAAVVAAP